MLIASRCVPPGSHAHRTPGRAFDRLAARDAPASRRPGGQGGGQTGAVFCDNWGRRCNITLASSPPFPATAATPMSARSSLRQTSRSRYPPRICMPGCSFSGAWGYLANVLPSSRDRGRTPSCRTWSRYRPTNKSISRRFRPSISARRVSAPGHTRWSTMKTVGIGRVAGPGPSPTTVATRASCRTVVCYSTLCGRYSWPRSRSTSALTISSGVGGVLSFGSRRWRLSTTSIPSTTRPKTVCLPFRSGVGRKQM